MHIFFFFSQIDRTVLINRTSTLGLTPLKPQYRGLAKNITLLRNQHLCSLYNEGLEQSAAWANSHF